MKIHLGGESRRERLDRLRPRPVLALRREAGSVLRAGLVGSNGRTLGKLRASPHLLVNSLGLEVSRSGRGVPY
jgi:hypothetical protein